MPMWNDLFVKEQHYFSRIDGKYSISAVDIYKCDFRGIYEKLNIQKYNYNLINNLKMDII